MTTAAQVVLDFLVFLGFPFFFCSFLPLIGIVSSWFVEMTVVYTFFLSILSETSEEGEAKPSEWNKEHFGMECEGYKWGQTVHSVEIFILKDENKKAKDYEIKYTPERIFVKLKGAEKPILDGQLWQKIKVDQCLWMVETDEDIFDGKV